jgi:hypothetical protein
MANSIEVEHDARIDRIGNWMGGVDSNKMNF